MQELRDYHMTIWIKDRRTKTGERVFGRFMYEQKQHQWMLDEVRDLEFNLYPVKEFRIEVIQLDV